MAEQVAKRIRVCLRKDENEPPLGVSVGIASYPTDGRTEQELLEAADERLYAQKKEAQKKSLTVR